MNKACVCGVLLAACTSGNAIPCGDDTASAFLCAGDLTLEVGIGEESFIPVAEGDVVELVRGPQAAQHVVMALRAPWSIEELPLDRGSVSIEVWMDGVLHGLPLRIGQQLVADGDDVGVYNLLWVVPDPDPVLGQAVEVLAELAPVGVDEVARGRVVVQVAWAPGEE